MGNVHSVKNAVESLGYTVKISRKEIDIRNAEKLILPEVGAFAVVAESIFNFTDQNLIKARRFMKN